MERYEMGTCEHRQVAWEKDQGVRLGILTIYCCPEEHGKVARKILTIKGFKPVEAN